MKGFGGSTLAEPIWSSAGNLLVVSWLSVLSGPAAPAMMGVTLPEAQWLVESFGVRRWSRSALFCAFLLESTQIYSVILVASHVTYQHLVEIIVSMTMHALVTSYLTIHPWSPWSTFYLCYRSHSHKHSNLRSR